MKALLTTHQEDMKQTALRGMVAAENIATQQARENVARVEQLLEQAGLLRPGTAQQPSEVGAPSTALQVASTEVTSLQTKVRGLCGG